MADPDAPPPPWLVALLMVAVVVVGLELVWGLVALTR